MLPIWSIFMFYAFPIIVFSLVAYFNGRTQNKAVRKNVYIVAFAGLLSSLVDFFYSWYLGFPAAFTLEQNQKVIKTITMYTTNTLLMSISLFFLFKSLGNNKKKKDHVWKVIEGNCGKEN